MKYNELKLILASQSPRRKELLEAIVEAIVPAEDETPEDEENPNKSEDNPSNDTESEVTPYEYSAQEEALPESESL